MKRRAWSNNGISFIRTGLRLHTEEVNVLLLLLASAGIFVRHILQDGSHAAPPAALYITGCEKAAFPWHFFLWQNKMDISLLNKAQFSSSLVPRDPPPHLEENGGITTEILCLIMGLLSLVGELVTWPSTSRQLTCKFQSVCNAPLCRCLWQTTSWERQNLFSYIWQIFPSYRHQF